MKTWSLENFQNPASEIEFFPAKVARSGQSPASSAKWIESLPVAAALFRVATDGVTKLNSNSRFGELAIGNTRASGLDLGHVATQLLAMHSVGQDGHFEFLKSSDLVERRDIELSIARFGHAADEYLVSAVDRTEEYKSRENLRREMLCDSLTGFFNRVGFQEEIEDCLNTQIKGDVFSEYAILLFDLARFSRVNESMGAMSGDELIITVAKRLRTRTRSDEILCRLGGNEFALFVPLKAREHLDSIAERLIDAFADPCRLSGFDIQVECAVSAAIGEVANDDPMDVLRLAQIAMKRAKKSAKFELYVPGSVETEQRRFSLETDLRKALENEQLQLHFQPLIDLSTGMLTGFEALARWQHEEKGFISPVDFIPVAEESGLIVPLGRWALEETARTIAKWDKRAGRQLPTKISVNLSAVQLVRDDVVQTVERAISQSGISGNRLTLELTESAFINDPDAAKNILHALKELDTHLAMDDFGTGYSNLAYLQQLPIDVLKIDRSFVTDIMQSNDKRAIVRTVLSLAEALGMQTTAEGIETLEVSAVLKELGCSFGQGYYYARPLTPEDAFQFAVKSSPLTIN